MQGKRLNSEMVVSDIARVCSIENPRKYSLQVFFRNYAAHFLSSLTQCAYFDKTSIEYSPRYPVYIYN